MEQLTQQLDVTLQVANDAPVVGQVIGWCGVLLCNPVVELQEQVSAFGAQPLDAAVEIDTVGVVHGS